MTLPTAVPSFNDKIAALAENVASIKKDFIESQTVFKKRCESIYDTLRVFPEAVPYLYKKNLFSSKEIRGHTRLVSPIFLPTHEEELRWDCLVLGRIRFGDIHTEYIPYLAKVTMGQLIINAYKTALMKQEFGFKYVPVEIAGILRIRYFHGPSISKVATNKLHDNDIDISLEY
jgi:hypothetical protein